MRVSATWTSTGLSDRSIDAIPGASCDQPGVGLGSWLLSQPLVTRSRPRPKLRRSTFAQVIEAAAALGVSVVNTFVGRDPGLSVESNWPRFLEIWRPMIALCR